MPSSATIQRFAKYIIGGSLYFWSGLAVFWLLYTVIGWSWFPAKVVADLVGWTLNYIAQRFWAFGDQHHLSEMQHAGRYVAVETVGFVLDYLIIGGLNYLGVSPYIGFFLAAGFFTIWNWVWYRYWVFPDHK